MILDALHYKFLTILITKKDIYSRFIGANTFAYQNNLKLTLLMCKLKIKHE